MKRFRNYIIALLVVVSVSLAASYYTVIIATQLQMKSGSVAWFTGSSVLAMGDSAQISVGALVADTSAFTTTSLTKAIYISGATVNDAYYISKRTALGVSTASNTDSSHLSYMAKTDSLIVSRTPFGTTTVSGAKFSYIRVALR